MSRFHLSHPFQVYRDIRKGLDFPEDFDDICLEVSSQKDMRYADVVIRFKNKQIYSFPFGSYDQAANFVLGFFVGLEEGYRITAGVHSDRKLRKQTSSAVSK